MNAVHIVLDDIGIEQLRCFGIGVDPALTPNIDALAQRGVVFSRAYSSPFCSSSRMLYRTGRYGFHTGVMNLVERTNAPAPANEVFIAQVLLETAPEFANAIIGKWHDSNVQNGEAEHPVKCGYDLFNGTLGNFGRVDGNYFNVDTNKAVRTPNGIRVTHVRSQVYATTKQANDAIAFVQDCVATETPFFLELAFNAAHNPFHRPPEDLYDTTAYVLPYPEPLPADDKRPYFKAAIQALDTELGRLLEVLPRDTIVFLFSDNGSPSAVYEISQPDFTSAHAKGTVYQQGTRVGCVVSGPQVALPGRVDNKSIISLADIFVTTLDILGVTTTNTTFAGPLDGVSFKSSVMASSDATRPFFYVEVGEPNGRNLLAATPGERSLGDTTWCLVRNTTGIAFPDAGDEFYDLVLDPWQTTNLTPGGATGGLTALQLTGYNLQKSRFITQVST